MFKRVMVAVVGLPLLILILGWAPSWATMLLLAAMCAIGAWELMRAAAGERGKPLTPLTVIAAAAVPVCVYGEMSIENTELTALPVLPFAALLGAVFIFAIFALAIHRYDEEQGIPFAAVTCAIFAGLAFPLMFSCLLRLRMMPAIGMLQVFLPLAISFGSDTFALFAGMLCGKHKLAPIVSPHKTVEGAIGGIFGSVLVGVVLSAVNFVRLILTYPGSEMVALTVALTMLCTVIVAKTIGGVLPLIAKACRMDPAIMASPLITTIVDALSLLIYFFFATWILPL